jgi:hypothetical protein
MDRVLAGLAFAFVYLDDIIIASPSMEQHQRDMEEVFRWLQAAGLVINFEKCTFAVTSWISWAIGSPPAVTPPFSAESPTFRSAGDGEAAAGLLVFNFYRRFVPAAAKMLRPLTDSTRGSPKATAAVDWTPPMVAAFDAARTALGVAALLAHPQQDQALAVMVDASADHFGAALQ